MDPDEYYPDYQPRSAQSWLKIALVIAVVLAGLSFVLMPIIMKNTGHPPWVRATNNAKQIFMLLIEFDDDFGEFPSDKTAAADEALKDFTGNYSNDYLGQLIAGGYVTSEEIFAIRDRSRGWTRPDDDISDREHILSSGECGYAYLKNLSTSAAAGTPVLLIIMTGQGTQFDFEATNGNAVMMRIDGSVSVLKIDPKSGEAMTDKNKPLFQGGKGTPWEDSPFVKEDLVFPK